MKDNHKTAKWTALGLAAIVGTSAALWRLRPHRQLERQDLVPSRPVGLNPNASLMSLAVTGEI